MKKTILLVDDTQSIREMVNSLLQTAGYKVLMGIDGVDAMKYLDGTQIHLILTDLHMPNRDGIELVKEIRKTAGYQYLPILLLTTESQLEKRMEAKKAGATGWIVKPFVTEVLLNTIKKVIR